MTDHPHTALDPLTGAAVSEDVFTLRPDYRALLLTVDDVDAGPGDEASEALLRRAESSAREELASRSASQVPHVAAWRETYRAFGAKPKKTASSLEALLRRAAGDGLPRINRLTDVYNAVSVLHRVPLGGEDLHRYQGPPMLVRATGEESFETASAGEPVIDHPAPGEVVWRDDVGVTCRRWNWRQCRRTALTTSTSAALFILDALEPLDDDALHAAADALCQHLGADSSARRLLPGG
ncbi:B3/4 domain-containing protein [Nesterenkonia sp. HG001]|uniref:B3/B4 domain-containing protein n=1 Tax=Nesterenkonia sp. HG001 TaxID=2983207 RepID=UPI002AC6336E|nr:phenylalanine--tRNA ligase beta subunit-related protein [Nesterenkonia sp. HG001]MDZ5076460.1 phenylalanine--tRNA ligase beta subunit-related protein [Nesterenkonia sp. HG001]